MSKLENNNMVDWVCNSRCIIISWRYAPEQLFGVYCQRNDIIGRCYFTAFLKTAFGVR